MWSLVSALQYSPEPDWWYDLIATVRSQCLGTEGGDVHPLLVARRTLLTLQSMVERIEQGRAQADPATLANLQDLVRRLREDAVYNWISIDPSPPHSNLSYLEVDEALEEIGAYLPEARQALDRVLVQPRLQVRRVLADWERRAFDGASAGLRQVLLWDPDRKRVLRAEQALQKTPGWLDKVRDGPRAGEHYLAFITDIEYEGRELRGQVGPAAWLDLILEGCRQLRRGAWPPDLFTGLPLLVKEMPWLCRFERRERLPAVAQENAAGSQAELANRTAVRPPHRFSARQAGPRPGLAAHRSAGRLDPRSARFLRARLQRPAARCPGQAFPDRDQSYAHG